MTDSFRALRSFLGLALIMTLGCTGTDAGADTGPDAGRDSSQDAGRDADQDAGRDASRDASGDAARDATADSGLDPDAGAGRAPVLSGFRVEAGAPSRVAFDASEPITGSTTVGFIISDATITSVEIAADGRSGSFVTSRPFDFFSNNLLRYEGGADLADLEGNPVFPFDLQYIDNALPEPNAPTDRYVSLSGSNGATGMSEGSAWRTIEYAAANVTAGTTVWVKAGDYGAEAVDVVNHGRVDAPIKFVGYRSTPGDDPTLPRSQDTVFSAAEMPLLRRASASGYGFRAYDRDYIILRNMQFEGYDIPVDMKEARFSIVDNVYVDGGRVNINAFPEYDAIQLRIINSFSRNASVDGIYLSGARHLVENNYVTSNRRLGMDYYIVIVGGTSGPGEHCVRENSVVRYFDDSHPGHGLSYKAQGRAIEHSLMENNYVQNVGLAIEARHSQVRYCVWRDNTLDFTGVDNNSYVGIQVTSARDCIFDGIVGIDYEYFIRFLGSTEDPAGADAGNGNLFKNCVFNSPGGNFASIIELREDTEGLNRVPNDNTITNCTFSGAQSLYFDNFSGSERGTGNLFTNCIFDEVEDEYLVDTDPVGFTFERSAFYSPNPGAWSATAPPGTGNVVADPSFAGAEDYTPTNPALGFGQTATRARYDLNGTERSESCTVGAIEGGE